MTTFLKRCITLIACCLVVTTGFAQGSYPLLEWSPEYNARSAKFDRILQSSEQGFFTYRPAAASIISGARDEYFAYYNRYDLSEQWLLKNPRWEWNGRRVDFKESLMLGGVQYLFYESYDRQSDTRNLLVRTLDTLANLSAPKLIETLDSKRRSQGDFTIKASQDRSKFAVFTNPPYERFGSENFYVRVYSADLAEDWNADIELNVRDRNFNIIDFDLSNSGDVFILSAFDNSPNVMLQSGKDLEYKLMRIGAGDNNQITEFDLGLRNVAVASVSNVT